MKLNLCKRKNGHAISAKDVNVKGKDLTLEEVTFQDNDRKVSFNTGLPMWTVFKSLLTFIRSSRPMISLNPFQQLRLASSRLRLNLPMEDLAYRFGVHNSTVSRVFARVIEVRYVKLQHLILWPDRDMLKAIMPMVGEALPILCCYHRLLRTLRRTAIQCPCLCTNILFN